MTVSLIDIPPGQVFSCAEHDLAMRVRPALSGPADYYCYFVTPSGNIISMPPDTQCSLEPDLVWPTP